MVDFWVGLMAGFAFGFVASSIIEWRRDRKREDEIEPWNVAGRASLITKAEQEAGR